MTTDPKSLAAARPLWTRYESVALLCETLYGEASPKAEKRLISDLFEEIARLRRRPRDAEERDPGLKLLRLPNGAG